MSRRLAILGATGSIGHQALDVVRELRGTYPLEVVALAGGTKVEPLAELAREFGVPHLGVAGPEEAVRLRSLLPQAEVVSGPEGLAQLASLPEADLVLNAVVGAVGLFPTLAALDAGKTLLLANKESLVVGGELVLRARRRPDQIVPVDSEHAALFQLLAGVERSEVHRVWITASGGPFRGRRSDELASVTPAQALAHPVWPMGRRITVDSATLVNKAFEVIEARFLFGLPWDRIGVLVHPQACVHALVELADGVVLAQLSVPDMRIPIRAALTHPRRLPPPRPLSLPGLNLAFESLDPSLYPGFAAVLAAGRQGGTAPAVANAADEILVDAFLRGEIPFPAIADGIGEALAAHRPVPVQSLADVVEADRWARAWARAWVARRGERGIKSNAMITSKRFGYGLCVLYELATREGGHHSARDLAQGYSVPEAFIRRILLDLRRAGFVEAQKGRMGGYQLAHPPQAIKLGDLMKALEPEEPVLIYGRQRRGTSMLTDACPVAPFWQGVEAKFAAQVAETTLADVIAQVGAPAKGAPPKRKAAGRRRKARK